MTQEEFEKKQAEALEFISKEFHKPIKDFAWEIGHSSGFDEVLFHVDDLVDHFKPAIETFKRSLTKG